MKSDITTPEDVDLLVREFYNRLLNDNLLGPVFTYVAKIDLEEHLPIIAGFWKDQLFDTPPYKGNVFKPHLDLHHKAPLNKDHFDRWIMHFHQTVDAHFEGQNAEKAKARATLIGATIMHKLISMDQKSPT